jgi:hypothetical protein
MDDKWGKSRDNLLDSLALPKAFVFCRHFIDGKVR